MDSIKNITKGATDGETASIITKTIVDTYNDMALPSKDNNAYKTLNASNKSNIVLVIKQKLLNDINLDYLKGVFNLEKVDLVKNIIPVKTFQTTNEQGTPVGDDIDFVIFDTKAFDNHVALQDGGMIYNPKGKYTNHYTNLWKVFGFKYFYNAKAFKLVNAA